VGSRKNSGRGVEGGQSEQPGTVWGELPGRPPTLTSCPANDAAHSSPTRCCRETISSRRASRTSGGSCRQQVGHAAFLVEEGFGYVLRGAHGRKPSPRVWHAANSRQQRPPSGLAWSLASRAGAGARRPTWSGSSAAGVPSSSLYWKQPRRSKRKERTKSTSSL
jgi:hypothetical protein